MTTTKLRMAMAAVGKPETRINALCRELGITRQTLYRYVDPKGNVREAGKSLLQTKSRSLQKTNAALN